MMPPMGALKPEDIAAATPQAIKTSFLTIFLNNLVNIVESVAPAELVGHTDQRMPPHSLK